MKSLRDGRVRIHAAIAPERPVAAHVLDALQVHLGDQHFFLVVRGLRDDLPEGIGDERSAPELQALARRLIAANVAGLEADAIGHGDVNSVGDGVGALDGLPGVVLRLAVLRLLVGMPADGRGIEEHVRALQRRQARALGIPLVPAHQRAELAEVGFESLETQIARREVILFVVKRIVGNMHLAVDACRLAAGVDYRGGVVVNAGGAPLEQRRDDRDLQLARHVRQDIRWSARGLAQPDRRARCLRAGRNIASETARAGRRSRRPCSAALRTCAMARSRFCSGSGVQDICTMPI